MPKQTKKNARKHNKSTKTSKSARKTLSVSDIRNRFKKMDESVRLYLKSKSGKAASLSKHVSRQWTGLFKKPLSSKAANSLARHYLNLHSKKGGSLSGAPLDHVMRPGLPAVAAYATFPTEVGADPNAVRDLDVYYNNALSRSCGTENTTARVGANIGSNQVPAKGGKRSKTARSHRRMTRKRGGDFVTALSARQYVASNPAGPIQIGTEHWYGKPANVHDQPDPTTYGWQLSCGTGPSSGAPPPMPTDIRSTMDLSNYSPYPQLSAVSYS